MSETLRILIPDHPDLALGRAIEFADELRHANDSDEEIEGWGLPAVLAESALQAALESIVNHDWHRDVGRDEPDARTEIGLTHGGVEHMGLYIATATPDQLASLAAALQLITGAEATDPSRRTPDQRALVEFVHECRHYEETEDPDGSLSAWVAIVRILVLAVATAPGPRSDRPMWLYDPHGAATPTPSADRSTPAADTRILLERLDLEGLDADGRKSVDLDDTGWQAWRRLVTEWHTAVYGPRADEPDAKLSSFAY